jgi:hypothetical protein
MTIYLLAESRLWQLSVSPNHITKNIPQVCS